MISRITVAALAALALPLVTGTAQEPPTVEDVLLRLVHGEGSEIMRKAGDDATSLLRKEYGPMSAAETRALIDALAGLVLSADVGDTYGPHWHAGLALESAVWRPGGYLDQLGYFGPEDLKGEPVPEAFDALGRIYETLAERALADGGEDPFLEAALRDYAGRTPEGFDTTHEHRQLYGSLRNILDADLAPDGRGWAYVLALFERSKPPCKEGDGAPEPPDCTVGPGSAWCAAGRLLHMTILGDARPWPGPDPDLWGRRCGGPMNGWTPWNHFSDWGRGG